MYRHEVIIRGSHCDAADDDVIRRPSINTMLSAQSPLCSACLISGLFWRCWKFETAISR